MASKYEDMARELAEAALSALEHDDRESHDRRVANLVDRFIPIIRRGVRRAAR